MRTLQRPAVAMLMCTVLPACAQPPMVSPTKPAPAATVDTRESQEPVVLAGEWEYEDSGIVQMLVVDEQGNGNYDWKDGLLMTTDLIGTSWRGYWYQRENDREGRFEITLSADYSEGEGRWWYTRIEEDTAPQRPGGLFRLKRLSALDDTSEDLY